MVFTFNTGLLTSVCALAATICVAAFSETFLYIFFFLLLGRLYTNSMLVTLNCREYIKSSSDDHFQEQYSLDLGHATGPQMPSREAIAITIDTNMIQENNLKTPH
ncbi:hypothetical protein MSAN_00946100 [Mycena sanguinolenta]|uniref:DUF6534 domain-containing protein n=1 Tax=Mycena sanguinolenta TaxID=230812 RepID=A0A8H6YY64_9AGAR|nr:hypothetical protein MSAN_00946100 [Mycena sanguinolenta]